MVEALILLGMLAVWIATHKWIASRLLAALVDISVGVVGICWLILRSSLLWYR